MASATAPFHLMTKPAGPACNLDCLYCFYVKKAGLFPPGSRCRMDEATLELFVGDYIRAQETSEITFSWQGGEPTLLGVEYYRRAVELQRRYAGGKQIHNALQTNGTLLDDRWGEFLRENQFLVGVSLDGPRELHDRHRRDRRGGSCYDDVIRGIEVLKKHAVDFNLLTVVSAANAAHPAVVYRALRKTGARFFQFIPLVEREVAPADDLAALPAVATATPESVTAEGWGTFMCGVFDEWIRRDVGRVFVRDFDVLLGRWTGQPASLCTYAETCGRALALEHDGSVYSCDHYVYESHRLGNLRDTSLADLVDSPFQREFGRAKRDAAPTVCRECEWWTMCHGGCPKHRLDASRVNHLCAGWRRFFGHIDRPMRRMAALLAAGRAPAEIM